MNKDFDRTTEDLGNSIHLEHVNLAVPDQRVASLFYGVGIGLTRDPYINVSDNNMWMNVGRSQFHLQTGEPQVLRGCTGLVVQGREALLSRLRGLQSKLSGTKFEFHELSDCIEAICPWGNRYRIHEPDSNKFGNIALGIPYVEFSTPTGSSNGIAEFYRKIIGAPAAIVSNNIMTVKITIGMQQQLLFRETEKPLPDYDNHHIQIYVADFSGPHRRLKERGLLSQEDNQHQYRFRNIVDPENGHLLFTIEHELRSLTHPMFLRPLVNRNPAQTANNYAQGHDQQAWSINN